MKSGNLNFLEPSGPLLACNRTALPLPYLIYTHIILSVSPPTTLILKLSLLGTQQICSSVEHLTWGCSEQIHKLYCSSNIIRVPCYEEMQYGHEIFLGKSEREHLLDLGISGRIILKWILNVVDPSHWQQGQALCSCEHSNGLCCSAVTHSATV